jgi:hypothetical protein
MGDLIWHRRRLYCHGILIQMILIDQGLIPNSKEYIDKFKEYRDISNKMISLLSTMVVRWKNQDFTDLCFEVCYSKNLGPKQWEIIYYILGRRGRIDLSSDISILRKYLDNVDREQSELYAEFASINKFGNFRKSKSEYWLKYHDK